MYVRCNLPIIPGCSCRLRGPGHGVPSDTFPMVAGPASNYNDDNFSIYQGSRRLEGNCTVTHRTSPANDIVIRGFMGGSNIIIFCAFDGNGVCFSNLRSGCPIGCRGRNDCIKNLFMFRDGLARRFHLRFSRGVTRVFRSVNVQRNDI